MKHGMLSVLCLLLLSACGKDNAAKNADTDSSNPYPPVPQGTAIDGAKNLAFLMSRFSSAVITPAPWAGYWWPYRADGISAAASKYDEVNMAGAGAWEEEHHGVGLGAGIPDWWGHCNGWAAAAILSREPRSPVAVSGVTFNVRDRKSLLSEMYMEVTGDFLGTRVDDPVDRGSGAFYDVVPAEFFLAIANILGSQKRSIVIDRYTGNQVWNQPLVAYFTEPIRPIDYLGPDPEAPNIHRVNLTTQIWWSDDNVDPDTTTPEFNRVSPADVFQSRTLKYELWLDAAPQFDGSGNLTSSGNVVLMQDNGRSVGGVWKNGALSAVNSHPDYMWLPTGMAPSTGYKNPRIDELWVLSHM